MPRNPIEEVHKRLGAFLVERGGMAVPSHFRGSREEHLLVRHAVGVFDLGSAGKLRVAGDERARFLHGLLTADVASLGAGQGTYSLLLTRDGRITSEMRVIVREDEILLLTPSLTRAKVRGVLQRLVAATRATVEDVSESLLLLSVQGRHADVIVGAALGQSVPELAPFASFVARGTPFLDVVVVRAPRTGETGLDLLIAPESGAALFERLVHVARAQGGGPAGLEALDALRVEIGVPAFGAEMDEQTRPAEVLGAHRGISPTKGCFLGREAMLTDGKRDAPERRIAGVTFGGMVPPPRGDKLLFEGRDAGRVTSGAWSPALDRAVALAMLKTAQSVPGTKLTTPDGEEAVVTEVPFRTEQPAASPASP